MKRLLEICVDTEAALADAIAAGADRIELCAALDLGGLTPSPGFMRHAAAAPVPVHALIRPRPGNFHYRGAERAIMAADIAAARDAGLAGVVIGASHPDRTLHWPAIHELQRAAQSLAVTLHRAFDLVPDPAAELEQAAAAGIVRILTSGAAPTAPAGATLIATLVRQAAGRLTIMPGGGVTPDNVLTLAHTTGATEFHASGRRPITEDPTLVSLGFGLGRTLDRATVHAMATALARAD